MKLLLDENLPHGLRFELPGHDAFTTAFMGWGGLENGELLQQARTHGFDALLTIDRGMEYQQNPYTLPLAVVVIESASNAIEDIHRLLSALLHVLRSLQPCSLAKVSPPV